MSTVQSVATRHSWPASTAHPPRARPRRPRSAASTRAASADETDVVVIGAGIGGLCAGEQPLTSPRPQHHQHAHQPLRTDPLPSPPHGPPPTHPPAGALLAKYGLRVTVCESHSEPGGAAHAWKREGYTFESGPSLYSGMAARPSANPIGQVLHVPGKRVGRGEP